VVEAAVDYEIGDIPVPKQMEAAAAGPVLAKADAPPDAEEIFHGGAEVVQLRRALTEMCAEVGTIRGYLETVKADAEEVTLSPGKRDALRFLKERGVREEHARELCGRVDGFTDIPRAMLDKVNVRKGGWNTCKAVMLVGPTGVGKTTTIAKLAAATRTGLRAAIVSLDNYRIGALEQIRIYSKIMGVPLEIATDAQRVKACVERHTDKDVVFIDTTGRNPLSAASLAELLPVYESGIPVETHLLVSATCDYAFLEQAWKAYSRLPIDYIGITKVDEAVQYGALYSMTALCGKPIAYLTTGQTVPGDIMFPSCKKLLQMVLTESPAGMEMETAALAQG